MDMSGLSPDLFEVANLDDDLSVDGNPRDHDLLTIVVDVDEVKVDVEPQPPSISRK